jgi:hypothetical protein
LYAVDEAYVDLFLTKRVICLISIDDRSAAHD